MVNEVGNYIYKPFVEALMPNGHFVPGSTLSLVVLPKSLKHGATLPEDNINDVGES